ncbi:MAG: dynamin family protein [Lachnospiraceae bacterium]|nr:dynamin family protein [Lachnospiraceae bacterium]
MDNKIAANNALMYLENALKWDPNQELANEIAELKEQNENRSYTVAVVGDFNRGKSTLINALLGMPVLPMGIKPMTATVNRITYGLTPKALIKKKDGSCDKIKIDDLPEYVTKNNLTMAKSIKEAVIEYPTMLCQSGIDILDTPGMNESEEMTAITWEALGGVHAAVVAVSAILLFSDSEAKWVADLIAMERLEYLLFAVTHIDELEEEERDPQMAYLRESISSSVKMQVEEKYADQEQVLEKANRLLNPETMALMPVSAANALTAFVNGNDSLLKASNLPAFKQQLVTLMNAQQEEYVLRKTRQLTSRVSEWITRERNEDPQDKDFTVNQMCTTAVNLTRSYPHSVKERMEHLRERLGELLITQEDSYADMEAECTKAINQGQEQIKTNEDVHHLLLAATIVAKNTSERYYREKWKYTILPVVEEEMDEILKLHVVLRSYCDTLLGIEYLLPEEKIRNEAMIGFEEIAPHFGQDWTLDVTGGGLLDTAGKVGKKIGNVFARGTAVILEKMPENPMVEVGLKKAADVGEKVQQRIGDTAGRISEAGAGDLTKRNLAEMIRPELAREATALSLQWQGIAPLIIDRLENALEEKESFGDGRRLEMALMHKAGEIDARRGESRKYHEEALNYIEKARSVITLT